MAKEATKTARLTILVTPKSSRREVKVSGAKLQVYVNVPPVEGKANEACIKLLADWLDLPKSALQIVGGAHQREKVVAVAGVSQDELTQRIAKKNLTLEL